MALVLDGTNGVSGVDGTASNPSLEGTDSNTGVFFPAADTVAIGTGGTERLRVDSAGNVGVGISSPLQRFNAVNTAITGGAPASSGSAADPNAVARFQAGSVALDVGVYAAGQMWLQPRAFTNYAINYDLVLQPNGGNVGIGTATVRAQEHIFGLGQTTAALTDAGNRGGMLRVSDNNSLAGSGGAILFANNQGDTANSVGFAAIKGLLVDGSNNTAGSIAFSTRGSSTDAALTERMRLATDGYMTGNVNGLGSGLYPSQQYYRLNAALVGANVNTAQNIFGVGVTLVGSTVYAFDAVVALSKSAGTTSHTISVGFGGSATINNISYGIIEKSNTTSFTNLATTDTVQAFIQTASATVMSGAQTSATVFYLMNIKGTVSVNAGGTFIPQYTLSAAPGGAYSTAAGSYIKIYPLSASGSNTSIGSWA